MVVGAKVCELTDGFSWFVCGLYEGILTSPLSWVSRSHGDHILELDGIFWNNWWGLFQNSGNFREG